MLGCKNFNGKEAIKWTPFGQTKSDFEIELLAMNGIYWTNERAQLGVNFSVTNWPFASTICLPDDGIYLMGFAF